MSGHEHLGQGYAGPLTVAVLGRLMDAMIDYPGGVPAVVQLGSGPPGEGAGSTTPGLKLNTGIGPEYPDSMTGNELSNRGAV